MVAQANGNNLVVQGRLIWGVGSNLFEGKQKSDYNTNVPLVGVDGNPVIEYGFGLAIPKQDLQGQPTQEYKKIWETLHNEAFTLYPSGQIPPNFAMKFKDGDGVDHNGKPFASREGYAGHIVLVCTTRIPIKYFIHEGGNNTLVNQGIKIGDYVNVQLNVKAHPAKGNGNPGLYINPSAVQLIQVGKEIINAPSGDQIFGGATPAYAGEVVAPTAAPMPGVSPAQAQQAAAIMPAPAAAPMPVAQAPVPAAPHYGVLPPTHQPPAVTVAAPLPGVAPAAPLPGVAPAAPMPVAQAPAALPASNGLPTMPGMPS